MVFSQAGWPPKAKLMHQGQGLGAAAAQHLCKPGLQFKHASMGLGVPAAKLVRWETCGRC